MQHLPGGADAQSGIAPPAYQLEYLCSKFDLAYSAGAEFDVVEPVAALYFLADLRVQLAHRIDCAEVEIFAEDERLRKPHQFVNVRIAQRFVCPFSRRI